MKIGSTEGGVETKPSKWVRPNGMPQIVVIAIPINKAPGISVKNDATLVALGQIFQPSVLLVIVGLISTAVLLVKNIPAF